MKMKVKMAIIVLRTSDARFHVWDGDKLIAECDTYHAAMGAAQDWIEGSDVEREQMLKELEGTDG